MKISDLIRKLQKFQHQNKKNWWELTEEDRQLMIDLEESLNKPREINDNNEEEINDNIQLENSLDSKSSSKDKDNETYLPYNQQSKIDLKKINKYGYDLSTQKELCNVINRETYLKKIIKTTCIKGKSILLVGQSGSGKTSIVETLALDIKLRKNPWLNDKTIFSVNSLALLAGAEYTGMFEQNLKELIDFCKENPSKIILFIDEIHTLYGLGRTKDSSKDAMNILKPHISNGDIIIIGATTHDEYSKYMTQDPAFLRRFEKIEITTPDRELTTQILKNYIEQLENQYKIKLNYTDQEKEYIINTIVEITDSKHQNIIGDIQIQNPTLAKNILEDAFVEAVYHEKEFVGIEEIYMSIIECDKIYPSKRKETAKKIKEHLLNSSNNQPLTPNLHKKVLSFPTNKHNLNK